MEVDIHTQRHIHTQTHTHTDTHRHTDTDTDTHTHAHTLVLGGISFLLPVYGITNSGQYSVVHGV